MPDLKPIIEIPNKKYITVDNLKTFYRKLKESNLVGASGAIIDVEELPAEDIDSSKIYRLIRTVQETETKTYLEHKVFVAGYFYENEKTRINSLEEQFTQLGLIKNEDYFEFIRPYNPEAEAAESWSQTQIVLVEFEKFYGKVVASMLAEQEGIDATVKVFYHELANHAELDNYLQSLNGTTPTEEELSSNCAKIGLVKLTEKYYAAEIAESAIEDDDNSWVNLYAVPLIINPDTGLYQQSGDIVPIHAVAAMLEDFNISAINVYQNNADELALLDISDFVETYTELINDSNRPWEFNPRHLWLNIEHTEEISENEHQESILYVYSLGAWKELGNGSGSSDTTSITYLTTAPTADNIPGKLSYVMLDEEPEEKYEGYIYIINSEDGSSEEENDISNLPLASEEDIELIFGIMNIDNDITVEDTTLVVGNDTTIDDNEHLLDLDGE